MEIDFSKLQRDYIKYPLKRREYASENDFKYLYIELNMRTKDVAKIFGCSTDKIERHMAHYNISKTREQLRQNRIMTNREKFGCDWCTQSNLIKEKYRKTCLQKYGVDNVSKSQIIKDKKVQTNLIHFNCINPTQCEEVQQKIRHNNLQKYGKPYFTQTTKFLEKCKKTNQQRLGVDFPMQSQMVQEKSRNTCNIKYGVDYIFQSEQLKNNYRKNCLEKYGVDNPSKCQEIIQKIKQTSLNNWGYDNASKSPIIKQKIKNINYKKYGCHPSQLDEVKQKGYETKIRNKTFNTSKDEEYIFQKLQMIFSDIRRQYSSEKYPYNCDFYIPRLDLYIEYNGFPTHGFCAYDDNNPVHINKANELLRKSKEVNFKGKNKELYNAMFFTWTVKDPEKRRVAKENKLNWVEFFNLQQFEEWFKVL